MFGTKNDYIQPSTLEWHHEPSTSTDKLRLLTDALLNVPDEKIQKVKTFEINWAELTGCIVPNVKIVFFE